MSSFELRNVNISAQAILTLFQMYNSIGGTTLSQYKERFPLTNYVINVTLLQGDLFTQYSIKFLYSALDTTVRAYPTLDKALLKTEITLI